MTLKRFFAVLASLLALNAIPAAYGDEGDCAVRGSQKKQLIRSIAGVCQAVGQGCVGKVVEVTQECCDIPVMAQIPCLGPMFKIGAGTVNMADGCKCCKGCAEGKNGACNCASKPKTATFSVEFGCGIGAATGSCATKVFTKAVRRGEPCMNVPTSVCTEVPMTVPVAPVTFTHPVPMAGTQCLPTVISSPKMMVVLPKPLHICVAKQEPTSEVRKVEWRTESDFLGSAGHLEIHNGDTTVCCEKLMLKTVGCGAIKVCLDGGRVSIEGECIKGKADHITTDHRGCLILKGNIQVAYEKDGQSVKVQGSHCTVRVMNGNVEVTTK